MEGDKERGGYDSLGITTSMITRVYSPWVLARPNKKPA